MATLAQLQSHVEHALGGTPASQLSTTDIVNQAGRHLYGYQWNFRLRGPVDVTLTANLSSVELPNDVGEIVNAYMKDGLTDSIRLTTIQEVVRTRNTSISTGANYIASIVWPEGSAKANKPPILELAPTPTSADVLTLTYLQSWKELSESTESAAVPQFCESVLVQMVRAFALGYEEENMAQRLLETEQSPLFQRALAHDGLVQPDYGPIMNGVTSSNRNNRLPFDTIADPTS
tara:strand:+ start:489 stop:1187 length:699 start_codon:yes stop_codon:yes gene_type:complete